MNQTRTFLILAWLMVAGLLWWEWNKEASTPLAPAPAANGVQAPGSAAPALPGSAAAAGTPAVPQAPVIAQAQPGYIQQAEAGNAATSVIAETDVLRLTLTGGSVVRAELMAYPQTRDAGSPPVLLFNDAPGQFYAAHSGWVSQNEPAPTHLAGFVPESAGAAAHVLPDSQQHMSVAFLWRDDSGVSVRREYVLTRGQYVIEVRDTVHNAGVAPWTGFVYRQLERVAPNLSRRMTTPNPSA